MVNTNKLVYSLCIAAFFFLIFTVFSFSNKESTSKTEGIIFFTGTWKQAVEKAQKENKPIFLDVYAKWCGTCKKLKKNTFTNKEVTEFYNHHFINLSLDGEEGEGAQIAAQLGLSGYPTLYYFNKNGKPVIYTMGYLQPKELINAGNAALKKIN